MVYYKLLIILLFLLPVSQSNPASASKDSVSVYLVKLGWHTGVIIRPEDVDINYFPEIEMFTQFRYIDIGWGDDEFYRNPGFDVGLAIKALFYSTPSTLRVEGFNFDLMRYIGYSDISYTITMQRKEFDRLTRFISTTFFINDKNETVLLEKKYGGHITFFRANGRYTAFNTCNTWVAKAFNSAGYEMSTRIVLAEELFDELLQFPNAAKVK
jgi:uncharacterized protein (TIGR02117 family)